MPFDARSAWERSKQLAPFPAHLNPYYEDILSQYEQAYKPHSKLSPPPCQRLCSGRRLRVALATIFSRNELVCFV